MSRIRVLVIDDSAFARKVIREVLARDPEIEVLGYARDGIDALEKIKDLRPDVITLDLVMPDLDGIGLLRAMPKQNAPRVVIVSVSGSDTELGIQALELGAVEIVSKPTALATDRLYELGTELVGKVKAAAAARKPSAEPAKTPGPLSALVEQSGGITKLVVIGTSTGGPQALARIFEQLPAGLPVPIAIALHIPAGYPGPLAARLSQNSAVRLVEAVNGAELLPGTAVISPGGQHLTIREQRGRFFAAVSPLPAETLYHPSVDLLFESAARAAGSGLVGVILTGMGSDGLAGAKAIRMAGGRMLAESAESCVVYGMPRCVIEAGLANVQAPIQEMALSLTREICSKG